MFSKIILIISIVTIFQLILFSVFLFSLKRGKISHRILTIFLIVNALFIINFIIPFVEKFFNISLIHYRYIGLSFGFLFGPLLYFFTKSLVTKDFRFEFKDSLHLIPFIIFSVIMIFSFHIYSGEVKAGLVKNNTVLPQTVWNIIIPLFNFQILCYLTSSILIINNYRKKLKDIYSAIEAINLSWLKLILYAFILMWIIDVLHFVFLRLISLPPVLSELMSLISLSINFVFALILILKALKYPELFFEMEKKKAKVKYEGSLLTKEESENYLKKLTVFMKIEKPYLIPSLTINMLAGKISLPAKILSQVINENLHQNFFDFINSYRIERAKELLGEPGNRKNILEIVYETGFNSKSVFNTAFKKHTGITPSQYKRQVQKSLLSNKVA